MAPNGASRAFSVNMFVKLTKLYLIYVFNEITNKFLNNVCNSVDTTLNKVQREILTHCMTRRCRYPPPLVVYGPFGTGKTETIAQSSVLLAAQNPDVKVLICTHTNQ